MTTLPGRLLALAAKHGLMYDDLTTIEEAAQALEAAPEGGEWRTIDSAPEGRAVLLAIEYANGKRRVIRAMRAGERTLHLGDDQDHWDGCLYDEAEDAYYCAPGWYEKNEFDEVNWAVSDKPIAWQPLPAAPSPTAALQAGVGRFVACRCVSERDRELCMTKDECSKVYAYSDTAPKEPTK